MLCSDIMSSHIAMLNFKEDGEVPLYGVPWRRKTGNI